MTTESFRDYGIDLPDGFRGNRATTCPKCSQDRKKKRNKCLSVNGDKGTWHCFNCGWKGGLKTENSTPWRERRKMRSPGADAPERTFHVPAVSEPDDAIDRRIVAYFAGRGISGETLKKCKVFSTYHYLGAVGEETLCIAFPYHRDGRLLNVKYRDANKNMSQEKDPEPCLWNIDTIKPDTKVVYITEGEIDALTLVECGFDCALSVDKGAPNPGDANADGKLECVTRCMTALEKVAAVYLVTDKDAPGLRLEQELLTRLGATRCYRVVYPANCKDINDVLQKCGRKAVIDVIAQAAPAPIPGLVRVAGSTEEVAAYWSKGKPRGLSTGWAELDEVFTIQMGSVNVITGIPGSGKSEFVHQLLVNMMHYHDIKCVLYSPEMFPIQNIVSNFAEKVVGKSFFGPPETRMTRNEMEGAVRWLDARLQLIVPDADKTPDIDYLLTAAQSAIVRNGCRAVVFDPYNEIAVTRTEWMSETEYVSEFMAKLRRFARLNNVWLGLVAHPTKMRTDPRTGVMPIPTLYDVAGSANFANKTDNGIALWRDTKKRDNRVTIKILKIKNKNIGTAGTERIFTWNRANGRFSPDVPPPRFDADDNSGGRER